MKRRTRIILLVCAVIIAVACIRVYPAIRIITNWNLHGAATAFGDLDRFMPSETPSSSKLGIPHHFFDESEFWKALIFSRRAIIHGHAFHSGDWISEDQSKEIGTILSDPSSYKASVGESMCGGFHADFYFRWEDSEEAIICLGCGEVLLIKSGAKFHCNLERSAHKRLIQISKEAEQAVHGNTH